MDKTPSSGTDVALLLLDAIEHWESDSRGTPTGLAQERLDQVLGAGNHEVTVVMACHLASALLRDIAFQAAVPTERDNRTMVSAAFDNLRATLRGESRPNPFASE